MAEPLLSVRGLTTEFATPDGTVHAVDHVSWHIHPGETLGLVGESGSGKSVTVLSLLGLVPQPPGKVVHGEAVFDGRDLLTLPDREMRRLRGAEIAMVFQDPMTSLNPVLPVGYQIAEAILAHDRVGEQVARRRSVEKLEAVGIPDAEDRFGQYPHELSGGMRQRAMIAMAVANQPRLLIADEPTTALDVTIQAQVLDVLDAAKRETHAATILITHDLGLIAEMADRVVVMYAGRVVETGEVSQVFAEPRHPYTLGLMSSLPRLDTDLDRLVPIPGQPPSLISLPSGCAFHPRCRLGQGRARCRVEEPRLYEVAGGRGSACHFHHDMRQEIRLVEQVTGASMSAADEASEDGPDGPR